MQSENFDPSFIEKISCERVRQWKNNGFAFPQPNTTYHDCGGKSS